MSGRVLRAGLVAGALLVVAACGSGDDGRAEVDAGGTPAGPSAGDPTGGTSGPPDGDPTGTAPTSGDPAAGTDPAGTSTVPAGPTDPGPSPVEGLDAGQLLAAVTAPVPPTARGGAGPTADRVALPDGRTAWRVRVPGSFPVRSAEATVAVGGRDLGPAVTPPDLSALVAVVPDAGGLVDGARVTYRWTGSDPVDAGALEVLS